MQEKVTKCEEEVAEANREREKVAGDFSRTAKQLTVALAMLNSREIISEGPLPRRQQFTTL